ncbi:MAG: hypothetical protein GC190_21150 [Alphaproteobacteria bacterium]|nr:hypothetical protein [Alphaproteobacteria bacterium]
MPNRQFALVECLFLIMIFVVAVFAVVERQSGGAAPNGSTKPVDAGRHPIATINGDTLAIQSLAISPDASYLAVGDFMPQRVKIWSMADRRWTLTLPAAPSDFTRAYLWGHPCRGIVINGDQRKATFFDCNGKVRAVLDFSPFVSPNPEANKQIGRATVAGVCHFAVVGSGGGVTVFDLESLERRNDLAGLFVGAERIAAPTSGSDCLAYTIATGAPDFSTARASSPRAPAIVYAVDMSTASRTEVVQLRRVGRFAAPYVVSDFAVSADGDWAVALTSRDNGSPFGGQNLFMEVIDVRKRTVHTRARLRGFDTPGWNDNERFFYMDEAGPITLIDAKTGVETPANLPFPADYAQPLRAAVAHGGKILAVADLKTIRLFRLDAPH